MRQLGHLARPHKITQSSKKKKKKVIKWNSKGSEETNCQLTQMVKMQFQKVFGHNAHFTKSWTKA